MRDTHSREQGFRAALSAMRQVCGVPRGCVLQNNVCCVTSVAQLPGKGSGQCWVPGCHSTCVGGATSRDAM